jgi:hypothetical protein
MSRMGLRERPRGAEGTPFGHLLAPQRRTDTLSAIFQTVSPCTPVNNGKRQGRAVLPSPSAATSVQDLPVGGLASAVVGRVSAVRAFVISRRTQDVVVAV